MTAAWQWRQLDSWVREALTGQTPAQLQARLEELSRERRRVIAELVSERAWRRLADNLGDRQRQALNSYVRAVTRFGKTGGKFAQRWLAEIRAALDESKDAIPVWIMPTARALTSFRPEADPPFDVLVVDEASQIGLEAAAAAGPGQEDHRGRRRQADQPGDTSAWTASRCSTCWTSTWR